MKTVSLTLFPQLNSVNPNVLVTDTFASTHSPTKDAAKEPLKLEALSSIRHCSSGSINTPVTPKPTQVYSANIAATKSEIKLTTQVGGLKYSYPCISELPATTTVRELQQSLKEFKDYTKSLEIKLRQESVAQETLEKDFSSLKEKYISELARADNINHEKRRIELELEDLTVTLFEQANEMVAHEKKISKGLEEDNMRLRKELSDIRQRLTEESMQLMELKEKFSRQEANCKQLQSPYPAISTMISKAEIELKASDAETSRLRINIPMPSQQPHINVNSRPYKDFVQFLANCKVTPTKLQYSLPYVKRTQTEDIDPCLWFGEQAPVSCKKILQAIMRRSCFIEEYNNTLESERTSAYSWISTRRLHEIEGCQLCLGKAMVTYRFRLGEKCEWIYIDYACRQKLVAVCEYYAFIRNILDGLYKSQLPQNLYNQNFDIESKNVSGTCRA